MIAVIVDAKDESARHFYERELSVVSRPTQEGCFGHFGHRRIVQIKGRRSLN
jgi:hypothetical protein